MGRSPTEPIGHTFPAINTLDMASITDLMSEGVNHGIVSFGGKIVASHIWEKALSRGQFIAVYTTRVVEQSREHWSEAFVRSLARVVYPQRMAGVEWPIILGCPRFAPPRMLGSSLFFDGQVEVRYNHDRCRMGP